MKVRLYRPKVKWKISWDEVHAMRIGVAAVTEKIFDVNPKLAISPSRLICRPTPEYGKDFTGE